MLTKLVQRLEECYLTVDMSYLDLLSNPLCSGQWIVPGTFEKLRPVAANMTNLGMGLGLGFM